MSPAISRPFDEAMVVTTRPSLPYPPVSVFGEGIWFCIRLGSIYFLEYTALSPWPTKSPRISSCAILTTKEYAFASDESDRLALISGDFVSKPLALRCHDLRSLFEQGKIKTPGVKQTHLLLTSRQHAHQASHYRNFQAPRQCKGLPTMLYINQKDVYP